MFLSLSGTAVFVGLMMMTAGFVLTLAGWFAPPITDTVLRVRMAGPVTLLLGFVLLMFSYILCAIEQQKCSECCYQYIRAREKENDIRSCDDSDTMMTSPNGMHIDHVITQNHVASSEHHSIPDQIQILQQHLAQLQMNQEAMLHPGMNYVYNPLIAAYSLHPNVTSGQVTPNGHVYNRSPITSHDQMEAIVSKNSHIPFIDEPSSDTSVQIESDGANNNNIDDSFPPQRGHIVQLPKHKKGSKHKTSKSKSSERDLHLSNVIKNSNAKDFHDSNEELWPKRRQSKKDLLHSLKVHSKKFCEDGNGALHLTDYYSQMQDASKPPVATPREQSLLNRVPTSERLSLCVPITPDSEDELTDKLEGLSTNSSLTSQLSPQINGTSKNSGRDNLGHVIVNVGTTTSSSWESTGDSGKAACDSTENSHLLPKESNRLSHISKHTDFSKLSSVKVLAGSDYVHKNTADVTKKPRQQKNVMSLDLVSHIPVTSPKLQKPITSVKPLPKNQSSPKSPKVLPLKSPKVPVARARIISKPDPTYNEMADSTV